MENSFYHNVLFLTRVVPPSEDFLKYFREGMFDRPNTLGFIHISQYLFVIYDPDRFKKLVQWPVFCKKTEAKYRTDAKDFLTAVANENQDLKWPTIMTSHLLHASGNKFSSIVWKLSTASLRAYLERESRIHLAAPQVGPQENISKKFMIGSINKYTKEIQDADAAMLNDESKATTHAKKMADFIHKDKEDILVKRQNLLKLASEAPVHPDMIKRLADPNDAEITQEWEDWWKKSLKGSVSNVQRLREIAELSEDIAATVTSIASADSNVLDGSSLPKIDIDALSKIDELSPETQVNLHRLYDDGELVLENLLLVHISGLANFRRYLNERGFPDMSGYDSEVQASCEDMTAIGDGFRTAQEKIAVLSSKIKDNSTRNHTKNSQNYTRLQHFDSDICDSVLLKSSPIIHINVNYDTERNDMDERLELTPVENAQNKALFARHRRHGDLTPQAHKNTLRPKLLVSRINFDETGLSSIGERTPPVNRGSNSRLLSLTIVNGNRSDKYSRLFPSHQNKRIPARFNSTAISVSDSSRLNSTTDLNATSDMYNTSELRPHIATMHRFHNRDFLTVPKHEPNCSSSTKIDETSDPVNKTSCEEMCKTEPTPAAVSGSKKQNDRNRRISLSDLIERYNKMSGKTITDTTHLEISGEASDESGKH